MINAGNSSSTLQIADGGISNISTILNRLQTLATESASSTFAGNRTTVNDEYQGLLTEINRQAASIGLNTGGANNTNLTTYVGGGDNAPDSQVTVDLSGANNAVDSTSLGIGSTSVAGGGTTLTGNTVNLNNTAVTFLQGGATATQTFDFNVATATGNTVVTALVTGSTAGITGADVVNQLNTDLAQYGISASIASTPGTPATDGTIQFGGNTAFTLTGSTLSGAVTAGTQAATTTATATNTSNYSFDTNNIGGVNTNPFVAFSGAGTAETIAFQNANGTTNVTLSTTLNNATSLSQALSTLNTALAGTGISAVGDTQDPAGTTGGISFQSASSFNITVTANTAGTGNLFATAADATGAAIGPETVTGPSATGSSTGNAIAALNALSTAISNLGLTQGIVGAGENKLNYATNLAQSQITNFSAAESGIKDANIAQEAANLTKAQVLQQASLAALAQANTAPQAVLTLLKS